VAGEQLEFDFDKSILKAECKTNTKWIDTIASADGIEVWNGGHKIILLSVSETAQLINDLSKTLDAALAVSKNIR
jgi:hypothetical protein